jgi:hypothetical protein
MDTQMGIGDFSPLHASSHWRETSSGWKRNSPQTRHKPKAAQTYNQGFLRVSAEGILVAKPASEGRFFP